jgi:hypothetical protein
MSKDKQIEEQAVEEMARVIETTEQIARDAHCGLPSPCMYAKDLYCHGYRKQSEGEWIRYPHNSGIYCSLCKHKRRYRDINDAYCPNCGAKMKGGGE